MYQGILLSCVPVNQKRFKPSQKHQHAKIDISEQKQLVHIKTKLKKSYQPFLNHHHPM